jgi:CcmD family protein
MNSNGKIYVVMAVVVVIVLGLFIYLFNIDRKITRLEKKEKL